MGDVAGFVMSVEHNKIIKAAKELHRKTAVTGWTFTPKNNARMRDYTCEIIMRGSVKKDFVIINILQSNGDKRENFNGVVYKDKVIWRIVNREAYNRMEKYLNV